MMGIRGALTGRGKSRMQINYPETGRMEITIPSLRNWFVTVFLGVWLIGWTFGELFALAALLALIGFAISGTLGWFPLLSDVPNLEGFEGIPLLFVAGFLLVWLTFWTYGGYSALRSFLWQLGSRELIEINRGGIRISRKIFGLGKSTEYEAREIDELRLAAPKDVRGKGKKSVWDVGALAFDYEFDTITFGIGLTRQEAEELLESIQGRYRQYAPDPFDR